MKQIRNTSRLLVRVRVSTYLYDPSKTLTKLQGTKHEASMKHLGQSITQYKLEVSIHLQVKSRDLARTQGYK